MPEHEPFNALPILMPLVGVLIGGVITFGYQSYFRWADRKRIRKERLRRVHHMTGEVWNSVFDVFVVIHQNIPEDHKGPMWSVMPAIYGVDTRPMHYSVDDMSALAGPKFDEIATELRNIAGSRNAIMETLPRYNELRREFGKLVAPYRVGREGTQMTTDVKFRENPNLELLEMEVGSLANELLKGLDELQKRIVATVPRYNATLNDLLGPKNTAKVELVGSMVQKPATES